MFRRSKPSSAPSTERAPVQDWRCYDSVADVYERTRAPVHEPPARDLVELVSLPSDGRLLDVGAGTGAAGGAAVSAGGDELVVGVDRSIEMGRVAGGKGVRMAVADAVDLPFRDETFDAAVAAFVLHLIGRPDTVLFEMRRVLRYGGRLGLALWAGGDDEFSRTYRALAERYVGKRMLADAIRKAVPSQERLSDTGRLDEVLRDAGIRGADIVTRQYRSTTSISEYLEGRAASAAGRFIREMLGDRLWARFGEEVEAAFRERFPDPLGDTLDVLLAVGVKQR